MTLWKSSSGASSHLCAALGRCLLFWRYHQLCHTSSPCLPPRSFRCPLQLPISPVAILSVASFHALVWSIAQLSPWPSSTRILLPQSLRTSLRSGTRQERALSLSTEMKFKSHFISSHCFVFIWELRSPSYLTAASSNPPTFMLTFFMFSVFTKREKKRKCWRWYVNSCKMVK